jgi:hypothetical protein
MVGVLVCMIIIPGFVFFLELYFISGISLNLFDLTLGVLVLWIYLIYYLSLTHMLGAFFNHRAPVIGTSLALVFGQQMLFGIMPGLARILPWTMAIPINNTPNSISGALISGQALPDLMPFYVALISIVIFNAIGLWRFNRQEV